MTDADAEFETEFDRDFDAPFDPKDKLRSIKESKGKEPPRDSKAESVNPVVLANSSVVSQKAKPKPQTRYALNKNKYLIEPEFERLEHILNSFKDKNPRDCTLLWLLLYTGARAQEILNLRIEDLNNYDETVFIRGLKGSNDREIPLPSWLFKRLNREVALSTNQILFNISYNRLRQIWEHYRPVHKKLHALRHTFAIRLYRKTKDLRLVQVALGHRNITNTMVYADYIYTQQELKKLIL